MSFLSFSFWLVFVLVKVKAGLTKCGKMKEMLENLLQKASVVSEAMSYVGRVISN